MRLMLAFLVITFFFSSACTKKEITIQQTNTTETIDGNVAPPFSGVTTVQIQNYINKIYIDLVGREPSQSERGDLSSFLKDNNLDDASRDQVMNDLMNSIEYYDRLWEVYSGSMLGGITQANIEETIVTYEYLVDFYNQQGETLIAQFFEKEIIRYTDLKNSASQLANDAIEIDIFIGRMLNNEVFEEINMGSENFVIAAFEHLFKRSPTNVERLNGTTMVDGIPAQLLFLDGLSKADFIEIMTTVPEFYQGLTIDIYQTLLARLPDSQEMTEATLELSENQDYQAIQRKVMKTEEYAGF